MGSFSEAGRDIERRGTKGTYGHKTMRQINRDIKRGGKIARKAKFAKAARTVARNKKKRTGRRTASRRR